MEHFGCLGIVAPGIRSIGLEDFLVCVLLFGNFFKLVFLDWEVGGFRRSQRFLDLAFMGLWDRGLWEFLYFGGIGD